MRAQRLSIRCEILLQLVEERFGVYDSVYHPHALLDIRFGHLTQIERLLRVAQLTH